MSKDILSIIQTNIYLPKGQQGSARFHSASDKAAFMTASKLGKTVNVSESTAVALRRSWAMTAIPPCRRPFRR